jgi:uncharacterized protein
MLDPREYILFDEIDKHGPQTVSRTYSLSAAELDRDDVVNVGPVSITASAQKGALPGEYLVDGSAKFTADLACARCLEPYPFASSSTFHLRFRPRPEVLQREDEELAIAPDELDVEFYAERAIPVRALALEQIQLSTPMKPLCNENCLGLCPQCGVNRNRETCSCQSSMADERWGVLRQIQQAMKKRES